MKQVDQMPLQCWQNVAGNFNAFVQSPEKDHIWIFAQHKDKQTAIKQAKQKWCEKYAK